MGCLGRHLQACGRRRHHSHGGHPARQRSLRLRSRVSEGRNRSLAGSRRRFAEARPGLRFSSFLRQHSDALAHPERYVIDSTRYLLVEFSNYSVPQYATDSLFKLGDRGLTVIITHPERNPILRENLLRVVEWAEQGCVVQVTGSARTGFWGERARRAAQWLLEHQAVHVLATDAHDLEKRVPILSGARDAAAELCGEQIAEALTESNPAAIVNNQPLPYFPQPMAGTHRKR